MMPLSVDVMLEVPSRGGGPLPASEKGRSGEHPAWRRALERAASLGAEFPRGAGVDLPSTPVAAAGSAMSVHGPTLAAGSAGLQMSAPRASAEPSRCGEDPAGVVSPSHEGKRRHAGAPLPELDPAAGAAMHLAGTRAENSACRELPGSTLGHRFVGFDAACLRVHVETDGASAAVWIGVDSSAAHVLDDAVAAVSRWLMREGCIEARWVCNGRELETPRFGRPRGASPLPVDVVPGLTSLREPSSGGSS